MREFGPQDLERLYQEHNPTRYIASITREAKDKVIVYVASKQFCSVGYCVSSGFLIGATVGGILGGVVSAGNPAVIVLSAAKGGAVGAGVGALVGVSLVVYRTPTIIEKSNAFKLWRMQAIRDKVYPIFHKQLKSDEVFADLCCPISTELPEIPVRAPCGHIYNQEDIGKWLDSNPTNCCHARIGGRFQRQDLTFNEDHLKKIILRCMQLREVEKFGIEGEIFRKGIDAVYTSATELNVQVAHRRLDILTKLAMENPNEIDDESYLKASHDVLLSARITHMSKQSFK